ncbi:MAG TPA: asparagine synthase (glutamine-hydrolyzing) [Alphaproteobacteria bacterium]|nr:asparagine synthase (glutamine-hydrolyzing) [Alphaproteobacteria bacterium]
MCGIAGLLDHSRTLGGDSLESLAARMAGTLLHRGPDDGGAWSAANAGIGFGFRRLAIIDLTPAGHQPMLADDGKSAIVFNGEIYNAEDIRRELDAMGGAPNGGWRGHSDTEVLLQACRRFGVVGATQRLVGMFAFAFWDDAAQRLTLVRDRLGIKPLYWARAGKQFLFASELKALRAHPDFSAEIDDTALSAYLRQAYVPAPRSIYRDAAKLPPGHMLTVTAGGEPQISRYWNLRDIARDGQRAAKNKPIDNAAAIEEMDKLLREAVKLRMIADVPLGAFLSGGIDSSTVVALMQAQSDRPVKTFTIGFHEAGYNEAAHAKQVAAHLGTEHTELYISPDHALQLIPRIPDLFDEPFADPSQVPTYLVSEMTRRHVTVALSGDGGDELFAGYSRYSWAARLKRWTDSVPLPLRQLTAAAMRAVPTESWDSLSRLIPENRRPRQFGHKVQKLAGLLAERSADDVRRRLVGFWHKPEELLGREYAPYDALWDDSINADLPDFTARMQYLDTVTYLPDDILAKVDRASMAVSLEARVPLLDHRVVEHVWNLPADLKLHQGKAKWLLRQVLYKYVPASLVERPKMGFAVPINSWLRGPLRDWAESLLDETRLKREGIFDPAPIRRKWQEHLSESRDWQFDLWVVLMFQAWHERWRP